jgi:hypothetical protein
VGSCYVTWGAVWLLSWGAGDDGHGGGDPGPRASRSAQWTKSGRWHYDNIHVGIVRRADTIELMPGDAPSARWRIEVTVRRGDDGRFDFGGPFVHGNHGERHLGLRWGR